MISVLGDCELWHLSKAWTGQSRLKGWGSQFPFPVFTEPLLWSCAQKLRSVPCSKPIEQEHVDRVTGVLEEREGGVCADLYKNIENMVKCSSYNLKASTVSGLRILCLGRSPFLVPLFPVHLVKYYSINIWSHKFFFFKKHILYVFCPRACMWTMCMLVGSTGTRLTKEEEKKEILIIDLEK